MADLNVLPANGSSPAGTGERLGADNEQEWILAQERALLYLRALKIPPLEGLALAHEALCSAKKGRRGEVSSPVEETMKNLFLLLGRRGLIPSRASPSPGGASREGRPSGCGRVTLPAAVFTMPPLERGGMTSEEMDRKPWVSLAQKLFPPLMKTAAEVFNTRLQFLILLLLLITLMAW